MNRIHPSRKHARGFGLALGCVLFFNACRSAPLYNVTDAPFLAGETVTLADAADAIRRAGNKLGWIIEPEEPGRLRGTLILRQHMAVIDIRHNTRSFSIDLAEAKNLAWNGKTIHANYNGWIHNLEGKIRQEPVIHDPAPRDTMDAENRRLRTRPAHGNPTYESRKPPP